MNEQQNKPVQQQENTQVSGNKTHSNNTDPRQEEIENEQDTARIRTEKKSVEDASQKKDQ